MGATLGAWYNDWYYNVTGRVSPDQKTEQIDDCIQAQIKASGTLVMSPDYARSICEGTVTKALMDRTADPSQGSVKNALAPLFSADLPGFPGVPNPAAPFGV